jgi:hypothetical protein
MRRLGAAALAVSIGLACGGGSGSGDGQLTRIDTTTAENIARSVMLALDLTSDLSTIGSEVAGGGLSTASTAAVGALRIALTGFVPLAAGSPIGPITVDCENSGGTVTLTGTVANPDTLTASDHFTGVFDQCQLDAAGEQPPKLDGQLDFTVVTFSGDLADLFSLTLGLVFCGPSTSSSCNAAFEVTEGTRTFTVDGRVRTAVDSTVPPLMTSSASGSTLALTEPAPPEPPQDSVALRGFQTTLSRDTGNSDDPTDDTYQLTGNGRVASTGFDGDPTTDDGEVRYEVTTTLAGDAGSPPDAGIVLVTGSSSAMQIVPQADGTHVDLELDLDGNGSFDDDTITVTWADLGL